MQLKFSAIKNVEEGRFTIPVDGSRGSWIVKLPSVNYQNVPENEYTMMEMARSMGIDVPETFLMPIKEIVGLPDGMEEIGPYAFTIRRFDRSSSGELIHIEDFAQIMGVYPEDKKTEEKPIHIAVGIDWTAEEIRDIDGAIPQWLLRHFPGVAPQFIDAAFQGKEFVPISQKDTLAKHREKFNLQLQKYINVFSAHSIELCEFNSKLPIMLRALHIPHNCSDIERMAYTYIMQQAWTNIVRDGLNSECYPYVFPRNGGNISEDSFKILEDVLEANKNHPQTAQILAAFPLAKWNQLPTPQFSVSQVGGVAVFDII